MQDEHLPIIQNRIQKSNALVLSKYRASLMTEKILAIAIAKIKLNPTDAYGPISAEIFPQELAELVKDKTHIYRDLKNVTEELREKHVYLEDDQNERLEMIQAFNRVVYEKGKFRAWFSTAFVLNFMNLETRYTTLEISILTSFSNHAAFRMYELLKKDYYRLPADKSEVCVSCEYTVAELKFMLGCVDTDDQEVKKIMEPYNNTQNVNWEEVVEKIPPEKQQYAKWEAFERRILKVAQAEINEKADIRFEYEGLRKGHAIRKVRFTIFRNSPTVSPKIPSVSYDAEPITKDDIQSATLASNMYLIYKNRADRAGISELDMQRIFREAKNDCKLIDAAFEYLKNYPEVVDSPTGAMLAFIRNGGYQSKPALHGSTEEAEKWEQFQEDMKTNSPKRAKKLWSHFREKEKFPEFAQTCTAAGLSVNELENILEADQLCDLYAAWFRHEDISLAIGLLKKQNEQQEEK